MSTFDRNSLSNFPKRLGGSNPISVKALISLSKYTMRLIRMGIIILAIIIASGLALTITITQPIDAWHTVFQSKKECVDFMKTVVGNTTSQAQTMCNKVIPHE